MIVAPKTSNSDDCTCRDINYAVCVSRHVSRQMVPVALCDCAEGFVFLEGQRR